MTYRYGMKKSAFIGDALLSIFTRETIAKEFEENGKMFLVCSNLCSNNYLLKVIRYFNLQSTKVYCATAYEARLYEIYDKYGIDIAYVYWVLTVYLYYIKHNQAFFRSKPKVYSQKYNDI